MEKTQLLNSIRGKQIADVIWSEEASDCACKIKTIITTDGFYIDMENALLSHPAHEKELAEFLDKLVKAVPGSSFTMRINELGLEEMRSYADEHRKKINAGGSRVMQIYNDDIKVAFDESPDTFTYR